MNLKSLVRLNQRHDECDTENEWFRRELSIKFWSETLWIIQEPLSDTVHHSKLA